MVKTAKVVFCCSLCFSAVAALSEIQPVANHQHLDKVIHIGAFAWLCFWGLGGCGRQKPRIICALVFYGIIVEFLQGFVPGRVSDEIDIISNCIGIVAGWLAYQGANIFE